RNMRLITKVLIIGALIAVLSYLFHPDVGQLSVMINGQPVAEPLVRIAAIPTFLMIMGLAAILTIMLFLGIGVFMFLGALFNCLNDWYPVGSLFLAGSGDDFSVNRGDVYQS
ncbi:MAG: hypothetical protein ACR65R_17260, partial [Methylomicrobium sp.]